MAPRDAMAVSRPLRFLMSLREDTGAGSWFCTTGRALPIALTAMLISVVRLALLPVLLTTAQRPAPVSPRSWQTHRVQPRQALRPAPKITCCCQRVRKPVTLGSSSVHLQTSTCAVLQLLRPGHEKCYGRKGYNDAWKEACLGALQGPKSHVR